MMVVVTLLAVCVDRIRDFIAFPKNNSGRDTMIDSPSTIDAKQMDELKIRTTV